MIIKFAVSKKLIVIADEVYRENVYNGTEFQSFRKILGKMGGGYERICELASLHSVSKGLLGEGGLRGGYMYIHNFKSEIREQLATMKIHHPGPNTIGQVMVELMVNPPLDGVTKQTKDKYLA